MSYEMEVVLVNDLKRQLAGLAREIVRTIEDEKVSALEGLVLGQRGMMLALTVLSMMKTLNTEQRANLLYVLEYGEFVVPEPPTQ